MSRSLKLSPQWIERVKSSQKVKYPSQQAFAIETGISLSTVKKFLKGEGVDRLNFIEFSEALGFDWQEIADFTELEISSPPSESSPFITGTPIQEPGQFFGRKYELKRLFNLLKRHPLQNAAIIGQRRMGKTSLLRYLQRICTTPPDQLRPGQKADWLPHPEQYRWIFVDFQDSRRLSQEGLLPYLLQELRLTIPTPCNLETFMDAVSDRISVPTVILLDEFECLDHALNEERFSESMVLGMLRNLIQHRPRFKVLISGSHTLEEFQRWASYLINVQVVEVSYLKPEEARQLIEHPVEGFTLRYEPDAVEKVLYLSRCHPFLVQLLCAEIVALKNEQDPSIRRLATLSDVEAAIPEALQSGSFFFADIEHNQLTPEALTLLRFIASQGEGITVPQATLLEQFPDIFETALELLLRRELIEPSDQGFRFQVELIRRWFTS